ncbi:MAG: Asp-tRNA(Asn)/Glu-tRNA(Gln) amidotransferase subunit GatA [Pseudomonadota bacterium]
MPDLTNHTIESLSKKLEDGSVTSTALVNEYIRRIDEYDGVLGAFLKVTKEKALEDAADSDKRIKVGKRLSKLDGIPIALKDNIITKGIETTCASKILEGYIPPYNATVTEKLEKSGAVMLGKLNMDEFAMGSSSEHSAYKIVRNPWNTDYTPGGSSGGAAAAIAASLATGTLGSDTGGSIRQPAAYSGVVGMKPTYGRVSRYGLVAFASSLDQIGPFGKRVSDVAILLGAISGHDPKDNTSSDLPVPDYLLKINDGVDKLKIGIPKEYFVEGLDDEVKSAIEQAIDKYVSLGAKIVKISLPHTEYAIPTYYIIAPAEASSNLARFDGIRYGLRVKNDKLEELYSETRKKGFGPEVSLRIILGTFVLSAGYYEAYYGKAQRVRTLISRDFTKAFEQCDLILTPTTPTPAFKLGKKLNDPVTMYLNDIFTGAVNLAGLPGISIPCGFSEMGLPIGMQLIGKPFDETTILNAANCYERETKWHEEKPVLSSRA